MKIIAAEKALSHLSPAAKKKKEELMPYNYKLDHSRGEKFNKYVKIESGYYLGEWDRKEEVIHGQGELILNDGSQFEGSF